MLLRSRNYFRLFPELFSLNPRLDEMVPKNADATINRPTHKEVVFREISGTPAVKVAILFALKAKPVAIVCSPRII